MFDLLAELNVMVEMAETLFGPRDESYSLAAPIFHAGGPQVFYPSETEILIKLSFNCSHDPVRTAYQLAHEAIHVLSPVNIGWATVLEEGIATCFAYRYVSERFNENHGHDYSDSGDPWLNQAYDMVANLLELNPDGIKQMREDEFVISDISIELIRRTYPSLSQADAELLTKHFQPWRQEQQLELENQTQVTTSEDESDSSTEN